MLPGPFTQTVTVPKADYGVWKYVTLEGRGPIYVEAFMPDGGAGASVSWLVEGYMSPGGDASNANCLFSEGNNYGPGPAYNASWNGQTPAPIIRMKVAETGDGTDTETAVTFYQSY